MIHGRWIPILRRSLIACACMAVICIVALFFYTPETAIGCTIEDLAWQHTLPAANVQGSDISEDDKVVYLTFDDGPSKTTEKVLDILEEKNVPATFFVMSASNNEKYFPLVSRIKSDGHTIGLHSKTHSYKDIYSSSDAFWADISALETDLEAYGISDIEIMRFPGGSSNTVSRQYGGNDIMDTLRQEASENGYTYFDWNVDAEDAIGSSHSPQKIYERVVKQASDKNTCIVLMHDTIETENSANALGDIIDWFISAGYRFDTLDNKP